MRRTIEQCENCRCAIYAFGLSRPILICYNKAGREGTFFVISPNENCTNFKPKGHLAGLILPTLESDGAKLIPLTQGKFAIVDADDYDRLAKRKWRCKQAGNTFYAYAFRRNANKLAMLLMHRQITDAPKGMFVDHRDGNGLNNRKSNLRLCTPAQNAHNRCPSFNRRSIYKGISWHKQIKKWAVRICKSGGRFHLGCFDDPTDAALAYDRKAEQLFGEFAYLNFPQLAEFRNFARKIIFAT
jgi:hypothetical protein